ncbi:MAG TPA: amino acid ABC transporter permease [Candidatus Borkfalkia avicola]|uniref:Amino acid ABC transporter permease n=1 Tax=Candidatus Borkfalkia avicola TaxID=2838503 RepID=A0A9D2IIF3_9FIRM|nr:amino acid ABC transporter permease [Candidatus Borkfalkia avicola]
MFVGVLSQLAEGFLLTLELFALTLVLAVPLGLIFSFGLMSRFKPLRYVVNVFVWVIRGTPLMLQLFIVCYGPALFGLSAMKNSFLAAVVAFVINYACYFAVIYRGGIVSISKGQYEAGQVLGMTRLQIFSHVVLLQVFKRILAPMSNEVITLVKDTSLANTLGGIVEIIAAAKAVTGTYALPLIYPLLGAGVFFLVFIGVLTLLFSFIEKKLNYFKV